MSLAVKMTKILEFPKNFLWGSATSAHQVEGNNIHNDWWDAEQTQKIKYKSDRACDHYNLYEQDFDLAKKLGQNAHRFSIEWSRIEPKQGEFNQKEIEHYRNVLLALKKRNIKSVVTLWHWTNPIWLAKMGGWANKKSSVYFERYAKFIVEELGDLIDFWVTLNEPMVHIGNGYLRGNFPPFKKNIFKAKNAFDNLVKAHQKSYKIVHAKYPEAEVSIAQLINYFEPARKWCPIEIFFAKFLRYIWNYRFLEKIKNEIDYIGVDYYFHNRIVFYPPFIKNLNKKTSDLGWEIYPKGIYYILKELKKYQKPIYITENGVADAQDKFRKDFIKDHLFWVHKAIQEGADVRGYFHWSLMDNFEWGRGFEPRFGLIKIDYKTMERKPRHSAYYYAQICEANQLTLNQYNYLSL
jgi:beta-glucosidase